MDGIKPIPLVTIIIPVYNVSAFIERCLLSVIRQTYEAIECIIVDDATEDDSIVKCEDLINSYKGIICFRILHHEHNRGLSAARNTGTSASTGDWVFYLDSDDELTEDCIENLMSPVARNADIQMVMGNVELFEGNPPVLCLAQKALIPESEFTSLGTVRDFFFRSKDFLGNAWNKLISKSFLIQNQLIFKEGIIYEDLLWHFFVQKNLSHLYIVPDVTYHYYRRPYSITSGGTSRKNILLNRGIVYEVIASHWTEGEEGREALFYLPDFFRYKILSPSSPSFVNAERLFKQALKKGHHTKQLFFLLISSALSRTAIGRGVLKISLRVKLGIMRRLREASI